MCGQTGAAAARRRRPRPARKAQGSRATSPDRPQARPRHRAGHARPTPPASCGGTPTRSSPSPPTGSPAKLTARAEAHTIRLALLYALLDGQRHIQTEHLTAALALWDYAARSAAWAIGHATGDPLAEQIHAALARSPDGLTRTQLRDLLHRNHPADQRLASARRPRRHRPRPPGNKPTPPDGPPSSGPPPTARDLRHGHTLSPTGLGQRNRAGRRGLSPSEARERKRSDLDSHAAGATIIQVQGARGLAAAGNPPRGLNRFFVPHP